MSNVDIPTLVALVIARAKTDKTAPDPGNLRVGWRTDQLLTGDVDTLLCYERNDPAAYAEVGRGVLAGVQDLPEVAALARLAIFRGERLLPVSEERRHTLLAMTQELESSIEALPQGTRKKRCNSLFQYHTGVFFDAYGCFAEAAAAQRQAADVAKEIGDVSGAAISSFVGAVYELKDALCSGQAERVETSFTALQDQHHRLIEAVRGTVFEVSWGQGNAPVHLIEACVWMDEDMQDMDTWATTALAAAEKLGAAWKDGADFVRAVQLHRSGDAEAEGALTVVAVNSGTNELKATALLILARRARNEGDTERLRGFIEGMPVTGAQHVRAVATQLLTQ